MKRYSIKPILPAILLMTAGVGGLDAAITYSIVGEPMPSSFDGAYFDITSVVAVPGGESTGSDDTSFTISFLEPVEWDVNFFFGGIGIAHSDTFQPFRADTGDNLSAILNVDPGTVVDAASVAANTLAGGGFGGSGSGNGASTGGDHIGSNPGQFAPGEQGYVAFVLDPASAPMYGWMRVTLNNDGSAGIVHDWALSSNGIEVGMVPEPATTALCLAAGVALFTAIRRRRRA